MSKSPKRYFALRLLRWFCPEHLYEEIEGDLIQRFNKDLRLEVSDTSKVSDTYKIRRAKRRLLWNVIRFFRPDIILRNRFSFKLIQWDMLITHLKFAIRAFLKDKFFSGLNVLGLALGISVSIVLLLIFQSDFTYDQHYAKHDRIYRLGSRYEMPGTNENIGSTARELTPIVKETYPEIEEIVRIKTFNHLLIKNESAEGQRLFYEEKVAQTDSTYFKIFDHAFIAGDVASCLLDPHSVVITESMAKKYFNSSDALDKTLIINNESRKVTAVIADFAEDTHLKFDFLLAGLPEIRPDWDFTMKNGKPISLVFWNPDVYTYLLLPDNYDPNRFYSRFNTIYNRYFKETGSAEWNLCACFTISIRDSFF